MRQLEWLDRRRECGQPCQLCRHRCGINAIERSGAIDYNECIQCLECVVILHDPMQCAPQLAAEKKRPGPAAPIRLSDAKDSVLRH